MTSKYNGVERRQFERFNFAAPLAYKVCKKETVSKLLEGYTTDISQGGLRCKIEEEVCRNNVLWLSFDRNILDVCREIDKRCLIYQNGILGKVAWAKEQPNHTYEVGIRFLTREEKNKTNIFPRAYFLNNNANKT